MKHMKHLLTAALAILLALVVAAPALADPGTPGITIKPNNDDESTESIAITYTYYKILNADIDTDPVVAEDGSTTTHGKVAYYVENQAQADAIEGTNLFKVTQVPGQSKWYVELKDDSTTADQIATAFDDSTFLANFTEQEYTKPDGTADAVLPDITAGYYFIKSSLGTKLALQTLSPVTINEKNSYPSLVKEFGESGTDSTNNLAGIGDTVSYQIKVTIPESVAEKEIIVVDKITDGLTLNTTATVSGAVAEPAYTTATFVAGTKDGEYTPYTITIPAATVIANKGKTLIFAYTATVNEKAVVGEPEENTAHLEYDDFKTVDVDVVETKTLAFDLQKVDTDGETILAGAEFSLWTAATDGSQINLVDITAAGATTKTYRVATAAESSAAGFKSAVIEAGTARIEGLNDTTYYLQEDNAPTGYNKLDSRTAATASEATSTAGIDYKIENNKGQELPSTGGMGTTILYVVGSIMVVGAIIFLITKKRVNRIEK